MNLERLYILFIIRVVYIATCHNTIHYLINNISSARLCPDARLNVSCISHARDWDSIFICTIQSQIFYSMGVNVTVFENNDYPISRKRACKPPFFISHIFIIHIDLCTAVFFRATKRATFYFLPLTCDRNIYPLKSEKP